MIELDEHEGSYLKICKHYNAVYQTPEIKDDKDKMKEVCNVFTVLHIYVDTYYCL
jgi:26S proteasome regulatory subunit N5